MLEKQNIVFDLDGVIIDTESGRYKLLAKILNHYGIDLKQKYSVRDIAGIPTDTFLMNYFPDLPKKEIAEIVDERRNIFLNSLGNYLRVYQGALDTIRDLKKKSYKVILATTNEKSVGEKLLEYIGIRNEFDYRIYRNDIYNKETQEKDYSFIEKKFNFYPANTIIIEDSYLGVYSAKSNSYYCIAFNRYDDGRINRISDMIVKDYYELRCFFKLEPAT